MDDLQLESLSPRRVVCDPLEWPADLVSQVDRFLFGASQWVSPRALQEKIELSQPAALNAVPLDLKSLSDEQIQRLADRVAPIGAIELRRLTRDWHARLALLDAQRWMDLGFTLSVLPFCGHVQRSMDGNFRRALRDQFGADAAALLDQQAGKGPALKFLLGPGAWKHPERVAAGGVRAAMTQLCHWGGAVRQRFALQFDPQVLAVPESVEGLNETSLEIACKLTLQDHPWLWS